MTRSHDSWRPRPILAPLAAIYSGIIRSRNALYDVGLLRSESAAIPVVSIGNVIAGGSGKTPFTRFLATELLNRGRHPVILARGYGGRQAGPLLVTAESAVSDVGDESLMQAKAFRGTVPVVIARRRVAGAQFIATHALGDIILLDDGFQHRALRRNVDLLLCDISSPESSQRWAAGAMLPAGWLREPLSPALRRATALVLVTRGTKSAPPAMTTPPCPVFHFQLRPGPFRDGRSGAEIPAATLAARQTFAVTAIANPDSFFDSLAACGIRPVSTAAYPDHADFPRAAAQSWWNSPESTVLCTEKDLEKLRAIAPEGGAIAVLEQHGSSGDAQAILELIEKRIAARHGSTRN